MKKATIFYNVHLDGDEMMTLKFVFSFSTMEQLQLASKEMLARWNREGITYVPDGGKEMRFWPSRRIKFIQAVISEN